MKTTRDVLFVMFITVNIYVEPLWSIITANLSSFLKYLGYGGYEKIIGVTDGNMVS